MVPTFTLFSVSQGFWSQVTIMSANAHLNMNISRRYCAPVFTVPEDIRRQTLMWFPKSEGLDLYLGDPEYFCSHWVACGSWYEWDQLINMIWDLVRVCFYRMVFMAWILGNASWTCPFCCFPHHCQHPSPRDLPGLSNLCPLHLSQRGIHWCEYFKTQPINR